MRTTYLIFFLFISLGSFSQSTKLIVKSIGKGLYIEHKVIPKENWYSIGRKYEISPREIAPFNGLSMDKGLSIGQAIKIPLISSNFNQDLENKTGIPVAHIVGQKEGLLHIASQYNITVAQLKKWNKLNTDQINIGDELVVGFVKATIPVQQSKPIEAAKVEKVIEPISSPIPQQEVKKSAVVVVPVPTPAPSEKKVEKQQEKVVEPHVERHSKVVENATVVAATPKPIQVDASANGVGYFSSSFAQQSKEGKPQKLEGFIYGVFKSSSGWDDGKYYVLLNSVIPGTIVKISVKGTDKSVFAKVLGSVPPGKESDGMSMRMSNSAASALGIIETNTALSLVWFN
jgi:LysM repeat protein